MRPVTKFHFILAYRGLHVNFIAVDNFLRVHIHFPIANVPHTHYFEGTKTTILLKLHAQNRITHDVLLQTIESMNALLQLELWLHVLPKGRRALILPPLPLSTIQH